jgi:hypothetical protein
MGLLKIYTFLFMHLNISCTAMYGTIKIYEVQIYVTAAWLAWTNHVCYMHEAPYYIILIRSSWFADLKKCEKPLGKKLLS